MENKFLNPYFM